MLKVLLISLFLTVSAFGVDSDTEVKSISSKDLSSYKHVIFQKEKNFNITELTLKVNEPVVFVNKDPIVHNVFSQSGKHSFNLKAQVPESASVVVFKSPGRAEVFCAIHPRMKMLITIVE